MKLVCLGSNVNKVDTHIFWTFNGKEISGEDSEWRPRNFSGIFSLHITNVSEKDVGKYHCSAVVIEYSVYRVTDALIELELYENGTFFLFTFTYN